MMNENIFSSFRKIAVQRQFVRNPVTLSANLSCHHPPTFDGIRNRIPRGVFVVTAAFLFLSALPAHADITIAAVGPMTGQDAPSGEQMKHGAEAAADAINATGGVLGQKLRVVFKDDACDPKQSVAVANQLAGESVAGVVGPMCSGAAIPAAKVYNEENIPMISPSATSPVLTDQGYKNVFRVCGRDEQQGKVVGDYIAKHFAGQPIALVHDKTAYGQGLADEVKKVLLTHGQKPALYESISRGERDYASLVSKLKQNNIAVVFFGGYHTEAGLIVRQMRDQNLKTVFISDDDVATRDFWAITGKAGEGALISFNSDPRKIPQAAEAVKNIRASGFDPEGMTLYTYAAVEVLVEAMRRAGGDSPKKVIDALHSGTFATVIGDLTFDTKGDITKPDYIIYRWSNGAYTPVEE